MAKPKIEYLPYGETTRFDLTNGVYEALAGKKNWAFAGFTLTDSEIPFHDGAVFEWIGAKTGTFTLPILIRGIDQADVYDRFSHLIKILNPLRGDGTLYYTHTDGVERYKTVRVVGGLDGSDRERDLGRDYMITDAKFFTVDPFWLQAVDTTTFVQEASEATFFPFPPLTLTSSAVYSTTTISNDGDADALPVWTITGPGDLLVLRNLTTDKAFKLNHEIEIGEIVTIDARIGAKTVKNAAGENMRQYIDENNASLFPLVPGDNQIRVEINLTTVNSEIKLDFTERYLRPYGT